MKSFGPGSQVWLSAALAAPIVEALMASDVEAEDLLSSLGLSVARLELEGARITHAQWQALIQQGTDLSGDPTFPLRAAECLRPATLGLGRYIASSPGAVGEAHGGMAPLFRAHHPCLAVELDDLGQRVLCRFRFTAGLPVGPELTEYLLACASVLGRALMGRLYQSPVEVCFRHAARTDVEPYRSLFGCEARFEAGHDAIVFPREHEVLPFFGRRPHQ